MPEIPQEAEDRAAGVLWHGIEGLGRDQARHLARAALEAAAPLLADKIATAILRYADEHEPLTGSGAYVAWHRHFDAASAVAAKAFGRDNLDGSGA